jgi:hypothetical protein
MSFANAEKFDHNFKDTKLIFERLKEWEWLQRFLEQNPDVNVRWEQHITYEILKKDE